MLAGNSRSSCCSDAATNKHLMQNLYEGADDFESAVKKTKNVQPGETRECSHTTHCQQVSGKPASFIFLHVSIKLALTLLTLTVPLVRLLPN